MLFALIALSDLLDGRLARRLATQSALGAVLDVTADLVFVIAADATLCLLGLLPWWLPGVALLKFAEFVTTSLVARRQRGEGAALWYDRVGRAMAVALYVTPLGALALHVVLKGPVCAAVIDGVCVTIAAVAFVSFVLRVRGVIASSCV